MRISLDDLALFVRVVDGGSFTAAARATGVPQGTVSRRIAVLEAGLGVTLLNRTTRRMALTEPGRRVHDHARLMLDQAEAATREVAELRREPSGILRVTAPVILGQAFISGAIATYMERFPKVAVVVEWTTRAIDPIEDGIDVALRIGRPPDSGLTLTRLGRVRGGLFAPDARLSRSLRDPSDLNGQEIFGLGTETGMQEIVLDRDGSVARIQVNRRLAANDIQPIIAVARACNGIALLPDFAAPKAWSRLLPGWSLPAFEVNAVSAPTRGALPRVKTFLGLLSSAAKREFR